jgi:hypothetical protein
MRLSFGDQSPPFLLSPAPAPFLPSAALHPLDQQSLK